VQQEKGKKNGAKEGEDRVYMLVYTLLLLGYAVFGTLTRSQDTFNGRYNNDRHRERR
jgi:hypothetical protein